MTYASYLYDLLQYSYGNYCSTYVRVLQYLAESTGTNYSLWIKF